MATRQIYTGTAALGAAALLAIGTTIGTVAAGDDSRITGAIQSSVVTTRGDLIRRGASAPERFAAVAADTFVGGDGTDVTTRTAAQVRTSLQLDEAQNSDTFADSAPWTLTQGAGSAGIAGNLLTLTSPTTVNTNSSPPYGYRSITTWGGSYRGFDAAVQLTFTPRSAVNTEWALVEWFAPGSALVAGLYAYGNGDLSVVDANGGHGTVASAALNLTNLWLRVVHTGTTLTVFTGSHATYSSVTWTVRFTTSTVGGSGTNSPPVLPRVPSSLWIYGKANNTNSGASTVVVKNVLLTWF